MVILFCILQILYHEKQTKFGTKKIKTTSLQPEKCETGYLSSLKVNKSTALLICHNQVTISYLIYTREKKKVFFFFPFLPAQYNNLSIVVTMKLPENYLWLCCFSYQVLAVYWSYRTHQSKKIHTFLKYQFIFWIQNIIFVFMLCILMCFFFSIMVLSLWQWHYAAKWSKAVQPKLSSLIDKIQHYNSRAKPVLAASCHTKRSLEMQKPLYDL